MIRVALALALALAPLSACASLGEEIRRGGDCRPDIGPRGLLKLAPEQAASVAILATPIEDDTRIVLHERKSGGNEKILDSWVKYSIKIEFTGGVSAAVWEGNTNVLDLEAPAETRRTGRTIVLTDRNDADLDFNTPGTLKVYAEHPNNGKWYVATVHVTQEQP